ncbi:hypothetical protein [Oceanobacillus rekensis]|uniref:hypothetical protein n=1 Tax=Oceanobacillus rekensis TaxID=937927 RepID=UPI000B43A13F|nr:hypothetical protein [Oceanobacillus rekensis]
MSIHKIIGEKMSKIHQEQQKLRPGQIIQGKILKIYPDNKAQIQLGSKNLIAQLEASLSIEGRYHFQVQSSEETIHLKVLGEELQSQSKSVAWNLIEQLGLKTTKSNIALVNKIISQGISFDRTQLKNALQLLDTIKHKGPAQQELVEMIKRNLPITENVFNALNSKNSTDLTTQMRELLKQLKPSTDLTFKMEQIINPPVSEKVSLTRQINADNTSNRQQIFQVLKSVGLLDKAVDFATWKSAWGQPKAILEKNGTSTHSLDMKIPFHLNTNVIVKAMEQVVLNKQALVTHSEEILNLFENKLRQKVVADTVLTQKEFTDLKEQLFQKITPHLSAASEQSIRVLSNNSLHLEHVLSVLKTFSDQRTYTQLTTALSSIKLDNLFTNASPKEQFLQQINQVLQYTGLSYENNIATNLKEDNKSIKSMLLQLLQHSDGTIQEKAGQLLHFINGMQLNSVNESANFIQASMQIPAEKLGLTKDMELEFESRKTADGKIDPDYCRILFYLNLEHLKQTVIDMNIQKRSVSVTIYNDEYPKLKDYTQSIQPVLSQGLDALNYHLSSIHFKALQEQKKTGTDRIKPYQSSYQGVDYRI